jgi:hypothetical protein
MPTLRDLQRAFAAHLHGAADAPSDFAADTPLPASARLAVYRNNSRSFFESALRSTYPVIERRVGPDYFQQLSVLYRRAHPATRGDLHWVGQHFPAFLQAHLADSPYAWLAELAALEWAIAMAAVAPDSARVGLETLRGVAPERLSAVRFRLIPSLDTIDASVPVLTVWRANQSGAASVPVDLSIGRECVLVYRNVEDIVELRGVTPRELAFVRALRAERSLEQALEESDLALDALQRALAHLFTDGCVAEIFA